MFVNHFAGFGKVFRDAYEQQPPTFASVVTRDYLGQNFYWDGSKVPVVKTFTLNNNGNKMTIQAGTSVGVQKSFAANLKGPPKDDDKVPIEIGNTADEKISTQSDTAHGKPSKYGGQIVTVPYRTFLWMIQPGDPSGGAPGGMSGGMPGMGGMPPGGLPPPAPGGMPPAGGATPPGAPPM